ncbi:MAG: UDP-N-acetylglucosamine--N-acetylmuramyl-(pentapeptide) pyrophosphoryl-undecaprenol N-acetylglucosamine transferase [Elusimicrobiota bacterium]|nr:UDP-N-acetylglucosamine--N-acetylmuramyl-(pentapeptide) pyrophosphoryl-undecaprenol N-acetylglucosamine transferase [Endomicrobiia bacterium]MDW8165882.1 UDP-N-acetylglucosamine--N-acetylmuramyl-(pentapeptide) pyrophosphoryl-undecaprenol N-acetylglucosamine transferase [Elusimicrobiota bacterium]
MNIIIVTSPTGGHFYPAIEISKKIANFVNRIIFIVQKQKNQNFIEIIKKELKNLEKINIEYINTAKFIRQNPLSLIKSLLFFIISSAKIIYILLKFKPKLIFSTGGYTSFPVVVLTKILFPTTYILIHEQNCVLSLSNKFLSFIASKVFTGFDIKKKSKKFIFTGNPIRESFLKNLNRSDIYKKLGLKENFTLLIFGGSQGATSINNAFIKIIKKHPEKFKNTQILHITGFRDFEKLKKEYEEISIINAKVFPYYEDMQEIYTISDLIISRAGAMTITELIYFKKPAILIPLPTAAELHQNQNAELLKKYNCAIVIYQRNNWEEKFMKVLFELLERKELIEKLSKNYELIPHPPTTIEREIKNILYKQICKKKI